MPNPDPARPLKGSVPFMSTLGPMGVRPKVSNRPLIGFGMKADVTEPASLLIVSEAPINPEVVRPEPRRRGVAPEEGDCPVEGSDPGVAKGTRRDIHDIPNDNAARGEQVSSLSDSAILLLSSLVDTNEDVCDI